MVPPPRKASAKRDSKHTKQTAMAGGAPPVSRYIPPPRRTQAVNNAPQRPLEKLPLDDRGRISIPMVVRDGDDVHRLGKQENLIRCQQVIADDQLVPADWSYTPGKPTMYLTIEEAEFAPSLKVILLQDTPYVQKHKPGRSSAHNLHIKFNLFGSGSIKNARLSQIQNGDRPGAWFVELTFDTIKPPIISNFDWSAQYLEESTREIARAMLEHASDTTFRFHLYWERNQRPSGPPDSVAQLFTLLTETNMKNAWSMYCLSGRPLLDRDEQVDRHVLRAAGQLRHHGRFSMYNNIEEFQIQQATSVKVMHMAEEDRYYSIDAKSCRQVLFYEEDHNTILAFVKCDMHRLLDLWGEVEGFPRSSDLVQLECIVSSDKNGDRVVRRAGFNVANAWKVEASLVLSLNTVNQELIQDVCYRPGEPGTKMNWTTITSIRVSLPDRIPKILVRAVQDIGYFPQFQKWHAMFLNHHNPSTTTTSMFDGCGLTESEVDAIIKQVSSGSGRYLRSEQIQALIATKTQTNHVQLLEGPGGSGKSTTAAAIVQVALQAGLNVLVVSETHAAADNIHEDLEMAAKRQKIAFGSPAYPLRLYKYQHETDYLRNTNGITTKGERAQATVEDEEAQSQALTPTVKRNRVTHQFARPDAGIGAAAAAIASDIQTESSISRLSLSTDRDTEKERPVRFNSIARSELDDDAYYVSMCEEMDNFNKQCQKWHAATTAADRNSLRPTAEQLKVGDRATQAVFKRILAGKRVIVTTANNCYSDLIRSSIAKGLDPKKGLLLVVDEASLMSDASLCALLCQVISQERIESEFGGINPIKCVLLVGDSKQLAPQAQFPEYTEFHPEYTLFKRLCETGFPNTKFRTQVRMQDVIGQWVDQYFYGSTLEHCAPRTLLSQRSLVFPNGGSGLVAHMLRLLADVCGDDLYLPNLGYNRWGNHHSMSNVDVRAELDAKMRLWLIDVPNGVALKDPSGSVFNMTNILYVTEFLLQLVLGTFYHQRSTKDQQMFFRWEDIAILVPYAAQKAFYLKELFKRGQQLGIDIASKVKLATIDSFASKEAKIVLLDVVQESKSESVGFLAEDDRALVAFTRAREFLFVFADSKITRKRCYHENWQERRWVNGEWVANLLPAPVQLIKDLNAKQSITTDFGIDKDHVAAMVDEDFLDAISGIDSFDKNGKLEPDKRVHHPATSKRLFGRKDDEPWYCDYDDEEGWGEY